MRRVRPALLAFLACLVVARPAAALVERVEILVREPFAKGERFGKTGAYERIKGRLHYALDPDDPANAMVVDLDLAPVDEHGLVTFAGDFILLRPIDPERGNGTMLYEVNNRGGLAVLPMFTSAMRSNNPTTLDHIGDGLLFEEGYSLLWSAWNWDVLAGGERLLIDLPIATSDGGGLVTGPVAAEFVPNQASTSMPFMWGYSKGYPPVDPNDTNAVLTWREDPHGERHEIPRSDWRFSDVDTTRIPPQPTRVTVDEPFVPGRIYEVVYEAQGPRVVGLGLAAIRDAIAHFRFDHEQLSPTLDRVIAFGISQSGRVINHMLWQGFHLDEAARMVIDGAFIHVAGAGKGSFNHRFAQTTRHPSAFEDQQYPADLFPFATVPLSDPVTGERGSMLDRARATDAVPKIVYSSTSTEYWTRAASLLHTDVDGRQDVPLAPEARLYVFAGAQHGVWSYADRWPYEHCTNGFDHRFGMRALLGAMNRWLATGEVPPDSVYPTFEAGTLGTIAEYRKRFPNVPGFRLPDANLQPPRLDLGPRFAHRGIVDRQPAGLGAPFVTAVPLPDEDGIDLGGIRLPGIAAPLATHTGWNLRRPEIGAAGKLARWSGSMLPFPIDGASRRAADDPRRSLEERYGSRKGYAEAVREAAARLADQGFLLRRDLPSIEAAAVERYDRVRIHDPEDSSCDYSVSGS